MPARPKNSEAIDRSLIHFPLAVDCNKSVAWISHGGMKRLVHLFAACTCSLPR